MIGFEIGLAAKEEEEDGVGIQNSDQERMDLIKTKFELNHCSFSYPAGFGRSLSS